MPNTLIATQSDHPTSNLPAKVWNVDGVAPLCGMDPMTRDRALLKDYEARLQNNPLRALLYFYTWDTTCITIGKSQVNKEKVETIAKNAGLKTYVRPTGGRAVVHGSDICYTFIAAQNDTKFGGNLKESFSKVNRYIFSLFKEIPQLKKFLRRGLSLERDLCWTEEYKLHNQRINCFSSAVNSEGLMVVNGTKHKILGAAQAMASAAFIQQGSLQLNKAKLELDIFRTTKSLSELTGEEFHLETIAKALNYKASKLDGTIQ